MPQLPLGMGVAIALLAVLAVLLIQRALLPSAGIAPFVLFQVAVVGSTWFGGRGPGLVSVALSAAAANYAYMGEVGWSLSRQELTATGLFIAAGVVVAFMCAAFRDVALAAQRAGLELQQHAEMLARSHEARARLASIVENTDDAIFSTDLLGTILSWNGAAERLFGYPASEAVGMDSTVLVPPEHRDEERAIAARLAAGEHIEHYETERLTRRGARCPVSVTVSAVLGPDGRVSGTSRIARDISERKKNELRLSRAQRALRRSEARFRAIFRNASDAIIVADASTSGRVVSANPAACKLFGYAREEFAGLELATVFDPADPAMVAPLGERGAGAHAAVELTCSRKDGSRFTGEVTSAYLEDEPGRARAVAVVRDVTERRRQETSLRESEERLVRTQAIARLGSWEVDHGSDRVVWSEEVYRIFGLSPAQFRPSYAAILEVVHPEDRAALDAAYRRSLHDGSDGFEVVHRIIRPSTGDVRVVHEKCEHVRDPSGEIVKSVGMVHDITEHQAIEEELRRRETTLAQAGQMAHLGAWDIVMGDAEDVNASALTWSDEVYRIFGYEPGGVEVTNDLFFEGVHPDDRARVARAVADAIAARRSYSIEHRVVRPDGSERFVQEHADLVFGEGGELVRMIGAVQDITERKLAEEALREADRRKDEFIAVLSHELRNPLAPIQSSLFILDHTAPGSEQARRARDVIARETQHMTRLITDLLDVSRITRGKVQLQPERIDLREVVERALEDHRGSFGSAGIELRAEQPEQAVWVQADPIRIGQALSNLLHNAAKFTRGGGSVLVQLRRSGPDAVLTVRDTGVGMGPELMARLFQPFAQADHTLDRAGGGLGLGLSLVKGLVELHGGRVEAESDGSGRGSAFTIRLPAETAPVAADPPAPAPAPAAPRGRRVLVIDDNVDHAESLKEVLELKGHHVQIALSGPEGLEKARTMTPDLVLCDIGLPVMDGYAVARAFRADEHLRDTAIVALTGYASSQDQRQAAEAGFDRHLAKPPDLAELEGVIAEQGAGPKQRLRSATPEVPSLTDRAAG